MKDDSSTPAKPSRRRVIKDSPAGGAIASRDRRGGSIRTRIRDRDRSSEHLHLTLGGREYVILPRDEFDRMAGLLKAADLPALPTRSADSTFPAAAYARVSLARKIITARVEAGLTQRALAKRAGIAFEHLNRIEAGKVSPTVRTVAKIESALSAASQPERRARKK